MEEVVSDVLLGGAGCGLGLGFWWILTMPASSSSTETLLCPSGLMLSLDLQILWVLLLMLG